MILDIILFQTSIMFLGYGNINNYALTLTETDWVKTRDRERERELNSVSSDLGNSLI